MTYLFYVSWSPMAGEAIYTQCFNTWEERDKFARGLGSRVRVKIWDREVSPWTCAN